MTCVKVGRSPRPWTICVSDDRLITPNPDCPNADRHTPQPSGYVALSNWAGEMLETHDQQECGGCGRLYIWVPKEKR